MKNFWQKNKYSLLSLAFLLVIGIFLTFKGVSADSLLDKVGQQEGVPKTSLPKLIGNIINIVLGVLGIILVVLIVWAGVTWMTAGGDSKKVEEAKSRLINAVIGLAIVISAYALASFVVKNLNEATSKSSSTSSTTLYD